MLIKQFWVPNPKIEFIGSLNNVLDTTYVIFDIPNSDP